MEFCLTLRVDEEEPCLLIADDTILSKSRSKKIDLVHYQYSGNAHDAGIPAEIRKWVYSHLNGI